MIDTKELRRLAQTATPGPWLFDEKSEAITTHNRIANGKTRIATVTLGWVEPFESEQLANARLIAAANPAAISELLDRLEASEKEREIDEQRIVDLMAELNRVGHDNEELRAKIETMEKQEPVARFNWRKGKIEWLRPWNHSTMNMKPLYLAPGAQGEAE